MVTETKYFALETTHGSVCVPASLLDNRDTARVYELAPFCAGDIEADDEDIVCATRTDSLSPDWEREARAAYALNMGHEFDGGGNDRD
ncbi:hypothetical protein BcepSauron_034 [Burkholderia phage BcepSauron]|uniref:Uncharacterized protein n=1 Tax=Burkholderia phage BcepSauron TaxID=2530033 RepID=A0A482MKW8_9CAUD|nr:hypothetical protein H1O17_gp034 [Burkholderia phage BcepSauron]QBQ74414.1 hypothetical protein BcepSauron_034 [Burkholderia phage BcepSauron]